MPRCRKRRRKSSWRTISAKVRIDEYEVFEQICREVLEASSLSECIRKAVLNTVIHVRVKEFRKQLSRLRKLLDLLELLGPCERSQVLREIEKILSILDDVEEADTRLRDIESKSRHVAPIPPPSQSHTNGNA